MASIIQARVESEMFRLQPVGVGVGPVGVRVVIMHGRRCDSWWFLSGRGGAVYAVEILRLGVVWVVSRHYQ